jgi:hypothetical protein
MKNAWRKEGFISIQEFGVIQFNVFDNKYPKISYELASKLNIYE